SGTDGVTLGAIAAGLQFAAIYPMSPISNILTLLSANQRKYGYIVKQVEDETAAINMGLGASFAGARCLTATSGGGFCLMTEGLGLAGQTETPLVIIEGMRGGPGTGLPTWSEQGDLRMVLHAHQGDFPRIVLAPGDSREAFFLTMKAFNLAEKYQTPVILLVDKNILDDEQTFEEFDYSTYQIDRGKIVLEKNPSYQRYLATEDGVSPRTFPGVGNYLVANSDEHNSMGYSSETVSDRNEQCKRD
ncbi:2-oxoacid:acceptor oxidoreductase subunit alpha, partial [bacterium]